MTSVFDTNADCGECELHARQFECYSLDSKCLICPSCLMFGPHKGEKVCSVEEGVRELRSKMDEAARNGMFRVDKTESILLDIRQTKLQCEENKARILKDMEELFNSLIKKLKERRTQVIKEIEGHYDEQISMIQSEEQRWIEKQDISFELLKLAKANDDASIIVRSKWITEGLDNLNEPMLYHGTKILSLMDTNLRYHSKDKNQGDLSVKELLTALDTYVQKGEVCNIQFRS